MEKKKADSANLNLKSGLYFNIGLFITMSLIVLSFEWKSYDDGELVDLGVVNADFEDLLEIPPTEQPPPPPPKIQQPEIIEVPDEEEIEEEIEVDLDNDINEDTIIDQIIEEAPEEEEVEEVFQIVEDPAMPPGGYAAFYKYVGKNLKYPSQARRMGIEGKVYVQFVVDKDGSITEVQSVKGIGGGCDAEAIRVLKNAPKWSPPKQRGKPVKQRIILPITFKLG